MLYRSVLAFAAFAAGLVLFPVTARAAPIFDTGTGNATSLRSEDSGPGQGVIVSVTTQIAGMAMYLAMPEGGQLRYFIFDGGNNSPLLLGNTFTVSAGSTPSWVQSAPFSFTLMAGSTYYFGAIADRAWNVRYTFPPVHIEQNGLASVDGNNSNYTNFAHPSFEDSGGANISLQLYGESSSVPEPAAGLLAGAGVLLLALRRLRRA